MDWLNKFLKNKSGKGGLTVWVPTRELVEKVTYSEAITNVNLPPREGVQISIHAVPGIYANEFLESIGEACRAFYFFDGLGNPKAQVNKPSPLEKLVSKVTGRKLPEPVYRIEVRNVPVNFQYQAGGK